MDDRRPPSSLLAIAARTEARIDALLADELARWSPVDPLLDDPITSLRAFMASGGKRLRPAFCHWAYVGAGGRTSTWSPTSVPPSSCSTGSPSSTTT
jgi:geranylgeranyl diphosphate synthase type I